MESKKVYNFAAGPSKVPEEVNTQFVNFIYFQLPAQQVLRQAQQELLNYNNEGASVMELSHRSKTFEKVIETAEKDLRDILSIPDNYKVLFMQGGGTGQFAAIPLNLCPGLKDCSADYLVTGAWSSKAAKEAEKYIKVNRVLPKSDKHVTIADKSEWKLNANASYLYYCENETIHGVEWHHAPEPLPGVPLVADMSSNFLTKPIDVSKYGIIFAGAQKNVGIAGLVVVIVREDLLGKEAGFCPSVLSYKTMADNKSLYNTPNCFAVYITGLCLKWIKANGGLRGMQERCNKKSDLIYSVIDSSNGFFYSPVDKRYRSKVNLPFRIGGANGDDELEKEFLSESAKRGMIQLKGHRSVGGLRASLFNAITIEETQFLANFMKEFHNLKQK
ncbi:Phosphoserine aminotransferase-like protein [Leptotrombidium deliense]|uniref:phosphoserine transaminase n=1 Tax=Leptotrombidium deliense TaxID=299467 RepID=A0A443S7V2_9ACAR|nr:Phosphoserine aminotransferase-like protein [Leptotrombidium deliense]